MHSLLRMHSFDLWLLPSFSRSSLHPVVDSFSPFRFDSLIIRWSFIDSFIHSVTHWFNHSFVRPFTHSVTHWFICSFVHSFIHSVSQWFSHWFILSFYHSTLPSTLSSLQSYPSRASAIHTIGHWSLIVIALFRDSRPGTTRHCWYAGLYMHGLEMENPGLQEPGVANPCFFFLGASQEALGTCDAKTG